MGQSRNEPCPICNAPAILQEFIYPDPQKQFEYDRVECPRCSTYEISNYAKDEITSAFGMNKMDLQQYGESEFSTAYKVRDDLYIAIAKKGIDESRSIISHILQKISFTAPLFPIHLFNILRNNSLSTPAELADNLILYLGQHQPSPGQPCVLSSSVDRQLLEKGMNNICGIIGTSVKNGDKDFEFVIHALTEDKIIKCEDFIGKAALAMSLTLAGWQRYDELKRAVKDSRRAFVAMEFEGSHNGNDYYFQTTLLYDYLIPTAKTIEWELSNPLASNPKAGNIHARLEVEIRKSRFVVAELSHGNNGAYWEAGFARGLGKPVIYMCDKSVKDKLLPHFDVKSDYIIFWDKDDPQDAADQLKAIIEATFFSEAIHKPSS